MESALARGGESLWQQNADDKSPRAEWSVGERNLPAMRKRNVAGDRQAEPRAAGLPIARGFQSLKRFEGLLERFGWDPGPSSATTTIQSVAFSLSDTRAAPP